MSETPEERIKRIQQSRDKYINDAVNIAYPDFGYVGRVNLIEETYESVLRKREISFVKQEIKHGHDNDFTNIVEYSYNSSTLGLVYAYETFGRVSIDSWMSRIVVAKKQLDVAEAARLLAFVACLEHRIYYEGMLGKIELPSSFTKESAKHCKEKVEKRMQKLDKLLKELV